MPQNRATLDQTNLKRNIRRKHISDIQPKNTRRLERAEFRKTQTTPLTYRRTEINPKPRSYVEQTPDPKQVLDNRAQAAKPISTSKIVEKKPDNTVKKLTKFELDEDAIYRPIDRQSYLDSLINRVKEHIQRVGLYYVGTAILISGMWVATKSFLYELNIKQEVLASPVSDEYKDEVIEKSVEEDKPSDLRGSEVRPSPQDIANYQVAPLDARVIRIPKLGVESRVQEVGETKDGAVATPKNIFDVGWYLGSDKVGKEKGAAFMMGHRHGYSGPGIFYELDKLSEGDMIEIELGNGEIVNYKVVTMNSYEIGSVDMVKALTAVNNDKFGLNLMTCVGDYLTDNSTYSERLLIRAEQV